MDLCFYSTFMHLFSVSYVQICAKKSEKKGSTQPLTLYCCRESDKSRRAFRIKGATAPYPVNRTKNRVENKNGCAVGTTSGISEQSCITSFLVTSPDLYLCIKTYWTMALSNYGFSLYRRWSLFSGLLWARARIFLSRNQGFRARLSR